KRRWAMTIDLARCTGCSACVTACYAENNIPTVGAYWQNATLWADERQVFNRCVGTRYCSNNCPYKVRYFNWFGYGESDRKQYAFPEPLNWQLNPDVTVRTKGVMEKCTFCVQRIREAENRASLEHRDLIPDEFTVACAAACPSRAIVFGDAADPNWSISQLAQDQRAYHVFEDLNTY